MLNASVDGLHFLWSDFETAYRQYLTELERLHAMQMERSKIEQRLKLLRQLLELEGCDQIGQVP